jgi:hypothetical protein
VFGHSATVLLHIHPGLSGQIVDFLLLLFAIANALVAITTIVAPIKINVFIVIKFKVKTVLIIVDS